MQGERTRSEWLRGPARVAALTVLGCLVLGALMGVVWSRLAPTAPLSVTEAGAVLDETASGSLIADDGWFAVLGGGLGLVTAILGWLGWRHRVLAVGTGLTVGSLLGGLLAWRVGGWLGPAPLHVQAVGAQVGAVLHMPLTIRATAVLLVWPITGLITLFALVAGAEEEPVPVALREDEPPLLAEDEPPLVDGFRPAAGDRGEPPVGGGQQVDGGELDVQPAPPAGDQH